MVSEDSVCHYVLNGEVFVKIDTKKTGIKIPFKEMLYAIINVRGRIKKVAFLDELFVLFDATNVSFAK